MPSKKGKSRASDYIVARGFNYTPKGKQVERRVDAGTELPADLTTTQVTRLVERGVVAIRGAGTTAPEEVGNG